ncbi:MAG TPA: serine/threonine-protein kinase [Trueperaceae bacterium]
MKVIGARFGEGYQVLREIARGALAHVYLASDGREAKALKLFPADKRGRAERELELGRTLQHPHLNPVEAGVEVCGMPGVLMPFVAGQRLGSWLESQASSEGFFASFGGILAALGYLHEQGIVHQDVKPENILIDKTGHARLLDFDLAVRVGDTRPKRGFAGTIAYLSPEQARGEPPLPASDLYAAGIICYRALTGQVPFTGNAWAVVAAHRRALPAPTSQFHPELAPFDPFFERLLAKDPQERFQSAAEVSAELAQLRAVVGEVSLSYHVAE